MILLGEPKSEHEVRLYMKKLIIDYIKNFSLFFALQLIFGSGEIRRMVFYSLVGAIIYLALNKVVVKLFKKGDSL